MYQRLSIATGRSSSFRRVNHSLELVIDRDYPEVKGGFLALGCHFGPRRSRHRGGFGDGRVYLYVRWKYMGFLTRIFQEKPLFIVPRGQPDRRRRGRHAPGPDGLTLARLLPEDDRSAAARA